MMSEEVREIEIMNEKVIRENKKIRKKPFSCVWEFFVLQKIPLIKKILKPLQQIKQIMVVVPTRTLIVVHDSLLISQTSIWYISSS